MKGATVFYLRKLFNELEVPYETGSKPSSEIQLLTALARVLLPDYSAELMEEILQARCLKTDSDAPTQ
eukprot:4445493-Alexandrium_andersonii.AAC.1